MTGPAAQAKVVTAGLLRAWELPKSTGDKNASGRVLVIGGNERVPGAVLLAAEAAMRAGAGKLQIATVDRVAPLLGVAIPESYVHGLPADWDGDLAPEGAGQILELAEQCDAALIGPGLKNPEAAVRLLDAVVPGLDCLVNLDALAMAYLTGNLAAVQHLAGSCVLSPNVVELFTTLGEEPPDDTESAEGEERLADAAIRLSIATSAVVLCGAATSFVAAPDGGLWRDETGGQGLAVSGSGDVKAGIIAGLLARGAPPLQAAVWATYVHGRCGERLTAEFGPRGFMARDLLTHIPRVVTELEY